MMSQTIPTSITTIITKLNTTQDTCDAADLNIWNTFYSLFMIFVLLCSVCGNAVVMLAVAMSHSLKHRSTFYFVASLACSDLVVAVFTVPFKISVKLHGWKFCHGLSACYLQIITDVFGNLASILNLLLISLDRFVAIQMPYKYVELLSSKISKRLVLAVWSISIMWSFIGIYKWESSQNNLTSNGPRKTGSVSQFYHNTTQHTTLIPPSTKHPTYPSTFLQTSIYSIRVERFCQNKNTYFFLASFYIIYIPVLLVMTCAYVKILHVALTQIRKIERNGTSTPKHNGMMTYNSGSDAAFFKQPKRSKWSLRKELRATKSVAIVYLAFCICWLPSCVISTIIYSDNEYFPQLKKNNETLFVAIFITFIEILPVFNTMVNPIIYSFSNTQFRNGVMYVWRKVIGKTPRHNSYLSANGKARAIAERTSCVSTSFLRSTNSLDRVSPYEDVNV